MQDQLNFFDDNIHTARKVRKGSSANPIVFHDYESFIAKFDDKPKTTDECWTPQDVYEAVVRYVGTVVDLTGKQILRPFYPGGDYEQAEYPEGGIVIDNPPFSIFSKICKFYTDNNIPFFLFAPGLTVGTIFKYCTAVIVSGQMRFTNGATVNVNFASNLYGDTVILTAPALSRMLEACPSQDRKARLPKYRYPAELVSVSDMQTICRGGIDFAIRRGECVSVRNLDNHPKKSGLFSDHILTTTAIGTAKEAAKEAAKDIKTIQLSEREKRIVSNIGN